MFLADENISPVLIDIIRKLGDRSIFSIHRMEDYRGAPDEEWIPRATQRNYVIITCDRRMLTEHGIAQALKQTQARCVFLAHPFASANKWKQALWLIRYWPKIREYAATMQPGDLARATMKCQIAPVVCG